MSCKLQTQKKQSIQLTASPYQTVSFVQENVSDIACQKTDRILNYSLYHSTVSLFCQWEHPIYLSFSTCIIAGK